MKERVKLEISTFCSELAKSLVDTEGCDLAKASITEVTKIYNRASNDVRELFDPICQKVLARMQSAYSMRTISSNQIQSAMDRYQKLYLISSTLALYRALREFDGDFSGTNKHFQDNFERYQNSLGI